MDITALENELKAGKLNNIYLLYGEERFLLDNNVKKIKKLFGETVNGINYIQIDNTNVSEIIADIETPAFGYPQKLIVAKDTGLFQKPKRGKSATTEEKTSKKDDNKFENKLATYIEENVDMIDDSVILLFIENDADKNNLYKTIDRLGCVCNFEKQKPAELVKRLKSICNMYKVNVDAVTLNYLIENCGTSLQDLINEIRKQIEYVGAGGTITKQNIDLLGIKQFEDGYKSKNRWLSVNEENVQSFDKDPLCGFICSFNFYYNLFCGLKPTFQLKRVKEITNPVPILLIAGDKDPVGSKGKGVKKLERFYRKGGQRVQCILYPNLRHEILNEKNPEKIYADVATHIEKCIKEHNDKLSHEKHNIKEDIM